MGHLVKGRHECLSGECGGGGHLLSTQAKFPFSLMTDNGMENLLLKSAMMLNWIGWLAI